LNQALALPQDYTSESSSIEMKIDSVTEGLEAQFANKVRRVSMDNRLVIIDYLSSMKLEINISHNHKRNYIRLLHKLSKFHHDKHFKVMTRDDAVSFLVSVRKLEVDDQLHKWIGTYNLYRSLLFCFFKWLYYPDIEPSKRPKPQVIENIAIIKRKETSIYKPSDLWTVEDDLLFLQYCPNKRDRCYHAMSRDTSCRPSELLKLKMKDIVFKFSSNRQYAEVLINGKTGSRALPLINSIPYVKDWLDDHPQKGNPNSQLICGFGKSLGRRLQPAAINIICANYKKMYFPKLLDNDIPIEDKRQIKELLEG
jgi:integrase